MNTKINQLSSILSFIFLLGFTQTIFSQSDSLNFNIPDSILATDIKQLKQMDVLRVKTVDSTSIRVMEDVPVLKNENETSISYWNKIYDKLKTTQNPDINYYDDIIHKQSNFQSTYYSYLYISNAFRYANNLNLIRNTPFDHEAFQTLENKSRIRYLYFLNQHYLNYSPPSVSNKIIKGISIGVDNDILQFAIKNEDRNYTGGGRLEITTDYFKMRLFDIFWKRNVISYQTIFIGGEAYTPRVQYDPKVVENEMGVPLNYVNGKLDESSIGIVKQYLNRFHQNDRPFASFYFIGRGKHRMHIRGKWRYYSEFKFGVIGSDGPKNVQAFIHRDLSTESKKILLWENQIAQGGRYIFNHNNKIDFRLYSSTKYQEESLISTSSNNAKWGNHIYLPVQVNVGTELTSVGTGIKWQNRSIRDLNGQNELIHTDPIVNRNIFNYLRRLMYLGFEANLNYVVHNTMLEGVGIYQTFENDPFDDDPNSFRELKSNEVERIVFNSRLFTSLRFKNSCLTYGLTVTSPEFNLSEKKWHAFGTVRFNFYL